MDSAVLRDIETHLCINLGIVFSLVLINKVSPIDVARTRALLGAARPCAGKTCNFTGERVLVQLPVFAVIIEVMIAHNGLLNLRTFLG